MKWSDTIFFPTPPRDIRPLSGAPPRNWEELMRQKEQEAYARGRREGEAALGEQLIQQRNEMAELQRGILDSLKRAVPQVIQESESALLHLALESARKVVADLPINVKLVQAVVKEALKQVEDTAQVVIQLHPDDLALLRKHDSELLAATPDAGPLRFTTSPEVTRGGCLVQTRFGVIDARREVKFEQLEQSLK